MGDRREKYIYSIFYRAGLGDFTWIAHRYNINLSIFPSTFFLVKMVYSVYGKSCYGSFSYDMKGKTMANVKEGQTFVKQTAHCIYM